MAKVVRRDLRIAQTTVLSVTEDLFQTPILLVRAAGDVGCTTAGDAAPSAIGLSCVAIHDPSVRAQNICEKSAKLISSTLRRLSWILNERQKDHEKWTSQKFIDSLSG